MTQVAILQIVIIEEWLSDEVEAKAYADLENLSKYPICGGQVAATRKTVVRIEKIP